MKGRLVNVVDRLNSAPVRRGFRLVWFALGLLATAAALLLLRPVFSGPTGGTASRLESPDQPVSVRHMAPLSIWETGSYRWAVVRHQPQGEPLRLRLVLPGAAEGVFEIHNGDIPIEATVNLTEHDGGKIVSVPLDSREARYVAVRTGGAAQIEFVVRAVSPTADFVKLRSVRFLSREASAWLPAGGGDEIALTTLKPGEAKRAEGFAVWVRNRLQSVRTTWSWHFVYVTLAAASLLLAVTGQRMDRWAVVALFAGLSLLNVALAMSVHAAAHGIDFLTYAALEGSTIGNLYYPVEAVMAMRDGQFAAGLYNVQRMPGYFVFSWLAALPFNPEPSDFLGIYKSVAVGHVVLWVGALVVFGVQLLKRLTPWAAVAVFAAVGTKVINIHHVQVDTVVAPCWLIAAALILACFSRKDSASGFGSLWPVHAAFLGLALLRTEFVLLWLGAAVLLPGRRWKNAALLAIGLVAVAALQGFLSWRNGSGFHPRMGTLTSGHVAFVGLWENDFHPFVWKPQDASYDQWISAHGHRYNSPEAARFATPEVIRFYVTFPIYTVVQAAQKFVSYWSEIISWGELQHFGLFPLREWALRKLGPLLAVALAVGLVMHASRREWVLVLPVLIALPLFCLIQFSGRYVGYIDETLLLVLGAVWLRARPWATSRLRARWAAITLVVVGVGMWALPRIVAHYRVRPDVLLWAPFAEPELSTLYRLKSEHETPPP